MTRAFIPDFTHVDVPTGSRYRRVEPGFMPYPYKCTGCGSSERACVDLDFQLTDDRIQRGRIGAVLLCTQCFKNAADVMGYVPVETMEHAIEAAVDQDVLRRANNLEGLVNAMVIELRGKVESYADMGRNILAVDFPRPSDIEVEMDMEPPPSNGQERIVDVSSEQRIEGLSEEKKGRSPDEILSELGLPSEFERQASEPPVVKRSPGVSTVAGFDS